MKKLLSFTIASLIALTSIFALPITGFAAVELETRLVENPVYTREFDDLSSSLINENSGWMNRLAPDFRDALVRREDTYSFTFSSSRLTNDELLEIVYAFIQTASSMKYSISAVDGDYIMYQIKAYGATATYYNGECSATARIYYRDSLKDEARVDKEVQSYLNTIDFDCISDYQLLKKFHDHILDICEYNNSNLYDAYNFTSYGVFCKGKAVCQGYALAFYRLCREAGFDCKIVQSDEEGNHAWNLVRLGSKCYYVDTTWDDDLDDKYDLFLVNYEQIQSYDFSGNHIPDPDMYDDDDYFNTHYRANVSATNWDKNAKNMSNCTIVRSSSEVTDVQYSFGISLVAGQDYKVAQYSKGRSVVTGVGDYTGESTRITTISTCKPVLSYTSTTFSGKEKTPSVTIAGLTRNTDYKVYYSDNINAGTATVRIVGINSCMGTKLVTFKINNKSINDLDIKLSYTKAYYDGSEKAPNVSISGLVKGVDYEVTSFPVDYGQGSVTVKGIGNYTSSKTKYFNIVKYNIADKKITLSKTKYTYNGYQHKPEVYISGLVEGEDYKVTYKNNTRCGTASAVITGINCFEGKKTVSFKIVPDNPNAELSANKVGSASLKWYGVKGADGYIVERYVDGKWKAIATLSSSKRSYVYKSVKPGTKYKLRVRAFANVNNTKYIGAGDTVSFTSKAPSLKTLSISSITSTASSITVKWGKASCTGYEVQYSTNNSFTNSTKKAVTSSSTTSKKLTSLKKGKKYYVRVRCYKTVNGKKCYGKWSVKKSIICK